MTSVNLETRLFINNEFVDSKTESTFALFNPATEEFVANVAQAGAADIDAAVAAAEAAFPKWRDMTVNHRAPLFLKLSQLIMENSDVLWDLERQTMGRTYMLSKFEVMGCAGIFASHSYLGFSMKGESSLNTPGMITFTLKQPYGVVAGIIPWNISLIMLAMKVAPAIAAGNCVIIKSSEKSPLGALKIAELIKEAGFPPGVVNIVTGFGNTGSLITNHMKIRKVAFTGSVETGKRIMAAAALSNLKSVTLELGGKSPAIVFADADLTSAVHQVEFSIHHNSGQHCQANSRVYVEESIAAKFIEELVKLMTSRSIGDPSDPSIFQGPQGDKDQQERIVALLEAGAKDGRIACGGKAMKVNGKGYFVEPTVITDVPDDSILMKEELFGPVVTVTTFKTEEEVLTKANDSEFGLFGSLYTKDVARALRLAKYLEVGSVGLNCSAPTQGLDMPVQGWKQSGIGKEMHLAGMENYVETKTVYMKYEDVSLYG